MKRTFILIFLAIVIPGIIIVLRSMKMWKFGYRKVPDVLHPVFQIGILPVLAVWRMGPFDSIPLSSLLRI